MSSSTEFPIQSPQAMSGLESSTISENNSSTNNTEGRLEGRSFSVESPQQQESQGWLSWAWDIASNLGNGLFITTTEDDIEGDIADDVEVDESDDQHVFVDDLARLSPEEIEREKEPGVSLASKVSGALNAAAAMASTAASKVATAASTAASAAATTAFAAIHTATSALNAATPKVITAAADVFSWAVFHHHDYKARKEELYHQISQELNGDVEAFLRDQESRITNLAINEAESSAEKLPYGLSHLAPYLERNKEFFSDVISFTILKVISTLAKDSQEQSTEGSLLSPEELLLKLMRQQIADLQKNLDITNEEGVTLRQQLDEAQNIVDEGERRRHLAQLLAPMVHDLLAKVLPNKFGDLELTAAGVSLLNRFGWEWLEGKVSAIIADYYDDIMEPERRRADHFEKLMAYTGLETDAEARGVVQEAFHVVSKDLTDELRELLIENNREGEGGEPSPIAKVLKKQLGEESSLTGSLQHFIDAVAQKKGNGNVEIEQLWGCLTTMIETALFRTTTEALEQARAEGTGESGHAIADVLMHLCTMFERYLPEELKEKRLDLEKQYAEALPRVAPERLEELKSFYEEQLEEIYRDSAEKFIAIAFPNGKEDLPVPAPLRGELWKFGTEELFPQLLAAVHVRMIQSPEAVKNQEDELKEAYGGSAVPKIFADVMASYLEAKSVEHLQLVDGGDEDFVTLKVVTKYFEEKSPLVSNYLKAHKGEIEEELRANMHALGNNSDVVGGLVAAKQQARNKVIAQGLIGVRRTIAARMQETREFPEELTKEVLKLATARLKGVSAAKASGRKPVRRSPAEKAAAEKAEREQLVILSKKLLKSFDLTADGLGITEGMLDKIAETLMPEGLEILLDEFVNPHTMNLLLRTALLNYQESKKLPSSSYQVEIKDSEDELNIAGKELMQEVARLSCNDIFQGLMKDEKSELSNMMGQAVGDAIRTQLAEKGVNGIFKKFFASVAEELVPGAQVVDREEGELLIDKAGNPITGDYDFKLPKNSAERGAKEKAKAIERKKVEREVRHLLGNVGSQEVAESVVTHVKEKLKAVLLWDRVQRFLDKLIHTLFGNIGSKLKSGLDKIFRYIFVTSLTRLFTWILKLVMKKTVREASWNVVKAVHEAFDRKFIVDAAEKIADQLNGRGNPAVDAVEDSSSDVESSGDDVDGGEVVDFSDIECIRDEELDDPVAQ